MIIPNAFDIIDGVNTHRRRVFTLILLLISSLIALWGFIPQKIANRVVAIYPDDMELPNGVGGMIPETRFLVVEWPSKIRVKDSGVIRLGLELEPHLAITPTAQNTDQPASALEITNIYDTHYVVAEARLELDEVEYFPVGQISEGLLPGKPVIFFWRIRPYSSGVFQGTAWLHLSFIPIDGGAESRIVLTAQVIEFQATTLLGLNGRTARVLGSVGFIVAVIMVLDDVLTYLLGRKREQGN